MKIVLHSDDLFLLQHWNNSLNKECITIDDFEALYGIENSLIILNYSTCNSKCQNILQRLNKKNKVLVLDSNPNIGAAKEVLRAGAKGYGNALMRDHFIISAVETICEDMVWLYPEFTTMLIEEIAEKKSNPNLSKLDLLSDREKEVALLLKEGLIYKEIAEKLNITARTVKAHASHIYTKLSVKDRLGLALLLK